MLRVFADAGLAATRRLDDGVIELSMPIPRSAALSEPSLYLDAVAGREQRADVASLEPLFAPRSVAVVGASHRAGSVGRAILLNIRDAGFAGALYAVNPHAGDIEGIPAVPAPAALPEAPDLAVVTVPADVVPDVAEECGQRGARSLVVITTGLTAAQSASLLGTCRRWGMRLVGPNCFGVAVPGLRPGRHLRRAPSRARLSRRGRPVRRRRRGPARALLAAGHRHLLVRVRRRQARRVRQRPAPVVGAGRHHPARRAVPGVVREPAQVRPHRGPGQRHHARAHRARRPVGPGPARGRLAHRRGRRAADHPAGPVRAGRHHRHHQLR